MIDPATQIGKPVITFTAPDPQGRHSMGILVGYYDCPTALIDYGDGMQHAWALHLCRAPTGEETAEYWRERALAAEQKLLETKG
jgi:hypothetical protein